MLPFLFTPTSPETVGLVPVLRRLPLPLPAAVGIAAGAATLIEAPVQIHAQMSMAGMDPVLLQTGPPLLLGPILLWLARLSVMASGKMANMSLVAEICVLRRSFLAM